MTAPLLILAVLSVFGGWVNVPESIRASPFGGFGLLPMSEWLEHWLEPVTHVAHEIRLEHVGEYAATSPLGGGHVLWAAVATGIALATVLLTARTVSRSEVRPAAESPPVTGVLRTLLHNKWYVDELYDRAIVRPLLGASRFAWRWIDQLLIDGTVNAVGAFTKGFGWFGSLFQSGQVTTYALVLTMGALAVLGALIF
jgi:NADH-quinone oxidoreductase subunit L